jgi:hypothetical protein
MKNGAGWAVTIFSSFPVFDTINFEERPWILLLASEPFFRDGPAPDIRACPRGGYPGQDEGSGPSAALHVRTDKMDAPQASGLQPRKSGASMDSRAVTLDTGRFVST